MEAQVVELWRTAYKLLPQGAGVEPGLVKPWVVEESGTWAKEIGNWGGRSGDSFFSFFLSLDYLYFTRLPRISCQDPLLRLWYLEAGDIVVEVEARWVTWRVCWFETSSGHLHCSSFLIFCCHSHVRWLGTLISHHLPISQHPNR